MLKVITSSLILGILIAAITTILSRKIELSIFSMIATFALSGLLFIQIGVPFFGFIYLIVYTAAISILFLFVLMMLQFRSNHPLSTTQGSLYKIGIVPAIIPIIYYFIQSRQGENQFFWNSSKDHTNKLDYHSEFSIDHLDTMQGLAYVLYTEQLSLLILISIILLIVMVGIISHLKN